MCKELCNISKFVGVISVYDFVLANKNIEHISPCEIGDFTQNFITKRHGMSEEQFL